MKFSCCIEMIYTHLPFTARIEAAAQAGFDAFEFWTWQDKDIAAIKAAAGKSGITPATFQASLDGVMVDSADKEIYIEGVKKSIGIAKELGVSTLFCMSDIMQEDRSVKPHSRPISPDEMKESTIDVLQSLAPIAKDAGVTLVIEPLNTAVDHPGYSLHDTKAGVEIIKAVDSPNVRLLYDAYHMQIMEGDIICTIKKYAEYFGYFHIADVPGRHQPGTGELNYVNILKALKASGYSGGVGFEFEPVGEHDAIARETLKLLKDI